MVFTMMKQDRIADDVAIFIATNDLLGLIDLKFLMMVNK